MQRMKLHLSGVKMPKLGSMQDRVYREYLTREVELEAKKGELIMLQTLTNPSFDDPSKRREWGSTVKRIWNQYLSLLLNVEWEEKTEKEIQMMEYYETVMKNSKLKLSRSKDGGLSVSGVDQLFQTKE